MFFVSVIDESSEETRYGITDTEDGKTDYFTQDELEDLWDKGILIYNMVYGLKLDDSTFEAHITSPLVKSIYELSNGTDFQLQTPSGVVKKFTKLATIKNEAFKVEVDGAVKKLPYSALGWKGKYQLVTSHYRVVHLLADVGETILASTPKDACVQLLDKFELWNKNTDKLKEVSERELDNYRNSVMVLNVGDEKFTYFAVVQ